MIRQIKTDAHELRTALDELKTMGNANDILTTKLRHAKLVYLLLYATQCIYIHVYYIVYYNVYYIVYTMYILHTMQCI